MGDFMPNYSSFLNSGFYHNYTEEQRKENLFFVFAQGSDEKPSFNASYIDSLSKKVISSVKQAAKICEQNEKGLISELCSYLREDHNLEQVYKDYVTAAPEYSDVRKIISNGGASNSQEIMQFFNSKYFNATRISMDNAGDSILSDRGESASGIGLNTDAFWRKLFQDSLGLVDSVSRKRTYASAFKALKQKWQEYAYSVHSNNWSIVGDYFGSLGDAFKETGLEDEMLYEFLGMISSSQMTAEQVKAIIQGGVKGKKAKFKVNKGAKSGAYFHGQYAEYLAAALNKFFLPRLYGDLNGNISVSATGTNQVVYQNLDFSDSGVTSKNVLNTGQTDIAIDFTFDKSGKNTSYKVAISSKLVQGFQRVQQDSMHRYTSGSDIGKFVSGSLNARIYRSGTLGAALNRINSSGLFRTQGLLSSNDFVDLAYLLINAAQGGISESERNLAVSAYKAAISFVGFEDVGEITEQSPAELATGNGVADSSLVGSKVVNLFLINGQYIPASAFFRELGKMLDESKTTSSRAGITFAKTFSEANSTNMAVYSPAYINFITNNDLGEIQSSTSGRNGSLITFYQGNPNAVRNYILSKSKAQSFWLKWTEFWRNFTG